MSKKEIWVRNLLNSLQSLEQMGYHEVKFWSELNEARKQNAPVIEMTHGGFKISVQIPTGKTYALLVSDRAGHIQRYHAWGRREEMAHGFADQVEAKRIYDNVVVQLLGI